MIPNPYMKMVVSPSFPSIKNWLFRVPGDWNVLSMFGAQDTLKLFVWEFLKSLLVVPEGFKMLPAHPVLLGMFSFSLKNFGKVSTQKSPLETMWAEISKPCWGCKKKQKIAKGRVTCKHVPFLNCYFLSLVTSSDSSDLTIWACLKMTKITGTRDVTSIQFGVSGCESTWRVGNVKMSMKNSIQLKYPKFQKISGASLIQLLFVFGPLLFCSFQVLGVVDLHL